jgi:hypothetical protein
MNAVAARLIVTGRHYSALVDAAADRDGQLAQGRVIAHLDGGVEAVAVAVDDFSGWGVHAGAIL